MTRKRNLRIVKSSHLAFVAALMGAAIVVSNLGTAAAPGPDQGNANKGPFQFEPLSASAPCTAGGSAAQPFTLPAGFSQTIVAGEPQFPDVPDMNTLNETGPQAGRF